MVKRVKYFILLLTAKGDNVIITIASQKGGVGKSTIAINLALVMAGYSKKSSIALVDADSQQSCIKMLQGYKRNNLTLYPASEDPHYTIEKIEKKHHSILIDTAPHSHQTMYQATALSDFVIIPLQPSPLDIDAIENTVNALVTIKEKYNPTMQCYFLINRITKRTTLGNGIKEELKRRYPFSILKAMLYDREMYKQSLLTGISVVEYDKGSKAARDMSILLYEINGIIKKK